MFPSVLTIYRLLHILGRTLACHSLTTSPSVSNGAWILSIHRRAVACRRQITEEAEKEITGQVRMHHEDEQRRVLVGV